MDGHTLQQKARGLPGRKAFRSIRPGRQGIVNVIKAAGSFILELWARRTKA